MNINSSVDYEIVYNFLNSLCANLDFLVDPNIEEKMVCTLDCCIGNSVPYYSEFVDGRYAGAKVVVGDEGLALLKEFCEAFEDAVYFDDKKGFSQEPRWLEFCKLVERVNVHIKQSVKEHKSKSNQEK